MPHQDQEGFSLQAAEPTVQAAELLAVDEAFLNTVVAHSENSWTAKVQVGSQYLMFKLDTGAEVTAITEDAYSSLQGVSLQKASKILYGPGRKPLMVCLVNSHRSYTARTGQPISKYLL